jgi:hypothetical protein
MPRRFFILGGFVFSVVVVLFFLLGGAYALGCLLFGGHDC